MIPSLYEFHWDAGHIIFLGVFYSVVLLMMTMLSLAVFRLIKQTWRGVSAKPRWAYDFDDLPATSRSCRHEIAGDIDSRTCVKGFDCRTCDFHAGMMAKQDGDALTGGPDCGIKMPEGRLYHRGHSWVEKKDDGVLRVGMDELASSCMGSPDGVVLPPIGSTVRHGDMGYQVKKGDTMVDFIAPVDGVVVEHGDFESGWVFSVKAESPKLDHLLKGREARLWMAREIELLRSLMETFGDKSPGPVKMADMMDTYPAADWRSIWAHISLDM